MKILILLRPKISRIRWDSPQKPSKLGTRAWFFKLLRAKSAKMKEMFWLLYRKTKPVVVFLNFSLCNRFLHHPFFLARYGWEKGHMAITLGEWKTAFLRIVSEYTDYGNRENHIASGWLQETRLLLGGLCGLPLKFGLTRHCVLLWLITLWNAERGWLRTVNDMHNSGICFCTT